jgi:hypothetical protein
LNSWKRFSELNRLIASASEPATRKALLKEYLEIGKAYNFDPHNELPS